MSKGRHIKKHARQSRLTDAQALARRIADHNAIMGFEHVKPAIVINDTGEVDDASTRTQTDA
jgi:hypothetical protein